MLKRNIYISIFLIVGMVIYIIIGNVIFDKRVNRHNVTGIPLVVLDSVNDVENLTGRWLFNVEDNITFSDFSIVDKDWETIQVPGLWNLQGYHHNGASWFRHYFINNNSKMTEISLVIPKVVSGYEVYINGEFIGGLGKINSDGSLAKEESHINIIDIPSSLIKNDTVNSIAFRISTISADGGFVETPFKIGDRNTLHNYFQRYLLYYASIAAILVFVGLYFILTYIVDRTYKHNILFGFMGILAALFIIGMKSLGYWITTNPWVNLLAFIYVPLGLIPYILVKMIHSFFRKEISRYIKVIMNFYLLVFLFLFSIPFSQNMYMFFFENIVIIIYIITIIVLIYCMIISEYAINTHIPGSQIMSVGINLFIMTAFIDAVANSGIAVIYDPISEGYLFFCIFMSIAASYEVASIRKELSRTNLSLELHNKSLHRFVPFEFFSLLNKHDILEINAGDNKAIETTVLFTDIRSFTTLSEKMSPRENFEFINSYLEHMVPVINKHKGYIDKYIGDAIMAIFPNSPDDAVNASVEMQKELEVFNKKREILMELPIEMGIGIHYGKLMLGIIGNKTRLEGTVISDTVNIASRIESLTKIFGNHILISNDLFLELNNIDAYKYRFMGLIDIKGKNEPVSIFEIFNGDCDTEIKLKNETKDEFEKGILSFFLNHIDEAKFSFDKVLEINQNDKTAKCFIEQIKVKENKKIKAIKYYNEIDEINSHEELEELEEV